MTTSCIAIRTFVRHNTASTLGYDDAFFVAAFAFIVIQSGMALSEVKMGFGGTIDEIDESLLEPAQQVGSSGIH